MTYGCEGSVRQRWELTDTGMISLADYYGAQHDWFLPMCISRTNAVSLSVRCKYNTNGRLLNCHRKLKLTNIYPT